MKKILMMLAMSAGLFASEYGTTNGELRAFSFDRTFANDTHDAQAITAGGIVRYETPKMYNLSATVAGYGSFHLGMYDRADGKQTALLSANGYDLAFIGEANLKYDDENVQVVAGRQRLSTPLANDHDLRLLPSTYQGVTATYKPFGIQIGRMTDYSGFGSKYNGFETKEFNYIWFSKFNTNAQYIHSELTDYYYADYMYDFGPIVVKAQVGGNDNKYMANSFMYGTKVTYKTKYVDVSLLQNEIRHNNFRAIESGAMYSDWMQGYGLYEPSEAYGFQLANTFNGLSTTIGAVKVASGIVDDYVEYQADLIYQINKTNKLRFRYSEKDQTQESHREDRTDTRVIYYWNF